MADGQICVVIADVLGFDRAGQTLDTLRHHRAVGKLVLTLPRGQETRVAAGGHPDRQRFKALSWLVEAA